MKKLFISFYILFVSCYVIAPILYHDKVLADGWFFSGGAAVDYTDCSELGSYEFYWNGDHATSNVTACKSGGTITGALDGGAGSSIVDSDSDPGTSSPTSGNNVVKITAATSYLQFAITAGDIFTSSEGYLKMDVYVATSTGINHFVQFRTDADNYFGVYINADNTVSLDHSGNDGSNRVTLDSTDTVSDTTWTSIEARWSVTNNKISVKIGAGSWLDDSDGDAVAAFASEPANLQLGYNVNNDDIYIDNVFVDLTSGY